MSDNRSDIWRLQAQFDIQGLIDALKQDDSGIRKRAAAALRAIGAKEAVPVLRVALINEQEPDVKAILASALETLSDEDEDLPIDDIELSKNIKQINKLIEMLESDDPEQIIDAAQQLGEMGNQIAVEPLVLVFNDMKSSMQVKLAVAEALLKLDGAPVEVALLAALRHTDWHIRRNGAAILGQLKAEWAVDPLSQALRDSHSAVRRTARAALQHIGTPQAMEAVRRRPDVQHKPYPEKPPTRPTISAQETIPSAPRDGLLNRLRENQGTQADEEPVQTEELPGHLKTTKPLDPGIVEQFNRQQQEKSSPEASDDD